MDYEEKYNAALERAAKLRVQNPFDTVGQMVEHIFPELKEDNDERIRKGLIKAVSRIFEGYKLFDTDVTREEALTWLEKQGKEVTNINGEDYGIDGLYHAIKILERTVGRVTGYQSDDGILSHEAAINAVKELYKKQGGQEHFYDFNANDWYVSKVDGKIHNMTYDPSDKVKPKFKVGDWITDGYVHCKITEILDDRYIIVSKFSKRSVVLFENENRYHLWTINDAQDGDILSGEIDGEVFVFLFNQIQDRWIVAHVYYSETDGEFIEKAYLHRYHSFSPATKEQHNLLFQKMKEAGYDWDSVKKELKKVESKTSLL